jgi:hypothetical protein
MFQSGNVDTQRLVMFLQGPTWYNHTPPKMYHCKIPANRQPSSLSRDHEATTVRGWHQAINCYTVAVAAHLAVFRYCASASKSRLRVFISFSRIVTSFISRYGRRRNHLRCTAMHVDGFRVGGHCCCANQSDGGGYHYNRDM